MVTRRGMLGWCAAAPFLLPGLTKADETWPNRPIRLILPYAAGGGTDTVARVLAAEMQAQIGQPVVVENRPGGGGNLSSEFVASTPPDGYTLLMGNQGPMAVNPTLFAAQMRVDPATAFDPVTLVAKTSLVVVAARGTPAQTMEELLAEIGKQKGRLTYASAGNGSASHLATVLLLQQAKLEATHVPFRGAGPALNDVVAGHVAFMVTALPSVIGLIEGGLVRPLAVTGKTRLEALPQLRPITEAGVPGYESSAWYGILVPRGTPQRVREKLAEVIASCLRQPDVAQRLRTEGADPTDLRGEAFGRFIHDERARWAQVIQVAGLSVK